MAFSQGLDGSKHAPTSTTSNDDTTNDKKRSENSTIKVHTANGLNSTPEPLPVNNSTNITVSAASRPPPPVTPQASPFDRIQQRDERPGTEHEVGALSDK